MSTWHGVSSAWLHLDLRIEGSRTGDPNGADWGSQDGPPKGVSLAEACCPSHPVSLIPNTWNIKIGGQGGGHMGSVVPEKELILRNPLKMPRSLGPGRPN